MISLALVLGSYRLADIFELSGPIAVVSAGLCIGSRSVRSFEEAEARTTLAGFWSLLDQLLNLMLFLLIGLQLLALIIRPIELLPIAFAVPLAVLSRAVSVAVPLFLTRESLRNKARDTAVLTWAGLRGGISIALALTLPNSAWRTELLVVTYTVVIFTIVVQGLTMTNSCGRSMPERKQAEPRPLFVVMLQIVVQQLRSGLFQQRFKHHVLAVALGEGRAVFLAERADPGVAVLLLDPAALVAMAAVKTAMCLCHCCSPCCKLRNCECNSNCDDVGPPY